MRKLFCQCCKLCEPGKIHPVMLTGLGQAAADLKPFSLRLCGSSTNEKKARQVFRYKQEKEEEVGNIR